MQVHELAFETKLYIAWISTWFQVLYDHILMWWKISCWESCISYCQAQLQFELCWAEIAFVSTFTSNIMSPNPNLNLTPTPTLVCMFTCTSPFFFHIIPVLHFQNVPGHSREEMKRCLPLSLYRGGELIKIAHFYYSELLNTQHKHGRN